MGERQASISKLWTLNDGSSLRRAKRAYFESHRGLLWGLIWDPIRLRMGLPKYYEHSLTALKVSR